MYSHGKNQSTANDIQEPYQIIAIFACSIGILLSACFNILIIIVLPRSPNKFGENGRLCLICIAMIDFLGGLSCFGSRIVFEINRRLVLDDRTVCAAVAASCTTFVSQSNVLFAIISVDRYIAIMKPMRYWSMLTKTRIKRLITLAIGSGLTVSIARMIHGIYTDSCDFDPGAGMYLDNPSLLVYIATVFILGSTTGYLNIKVLITAYKQNKRVSHMPGTDEEKKDPSPRIGGKFKTAVTITTIVGVYYFVWTPYVVGVFIVTFSGKPLPEQGYFATLYLAFSNHFLNAMIHFCFQRNLRNTMRRLVGLRETREDTID